MATFIITHPISRQKLIIHHEFIWFPVKLTITYIKNY